MSRSDREAAQARMMIRDAKAADDFIDRVPAFVLYDEDAATEKAVHLPHKKFWIHLT